MKKKPKSTAYYEKKLREMVAKRLGGEFDEFLALQVKTAAQCLKMIERIEIELEDEDWLTCWETGSQGQSKKIVNPLLVTYRDLQRTMIQHYASLGINYQATPSKMVESTKKGGDIENDPMAAYLNATK